MPVRILLGPQRPNVNLDQAAALLQPAPDSFTVVSAGWQDAEGELDDIHAAIKRPLVDLQIYRRAEELFAEEKELAQLYRDRQNKLKELQRLYRIRLRPLLRAARRVLQASGDPTLVALTQHQAVNQVRTLDRQHLRQIRSIHEEYHKQLAALEIPELNQQREAIGALIDQSAGVIIAGGHVAVLLNRMRLFGLESQLAEKPIIAWSAGVMVLCERVVLYHDHAPEGRREAEVFDTGLGLVPSLIALPYANHRLDQSDSTHLALIARRFGPAACVTFNSGALIRSEANQIQHAENARRILRSGRLRKVRGG